MNALGANRIVQFNFLDIRLNRLLSNDYPLNIVAIKDHINSNFLVLWQKRPKKNRL